MTIQETLLFISISVLTGCLMTLIKEYFVTKGKNLATKEDIAEITEKVENIKHKFDRLSHKSNALIERRIKAFDMIGDELAEIQLYCLRKTQKSEHAVPYQELSDKSTFQRAVHLSEIAHKQRIYISKEVWSAVMNLSQSAFNLGVAELGTANLNEEDGHYEVEDKYYEEVRLSAKKIASDMKEEIFGNN